MLRRPRVRDALTIRGIPSIRFHTTNEAGHARQPLRAAATAPELSDGGGCTRKSGRLGRQQSKLVCEQENRDCHRDERYAPEDPIADQSVYDDGDFALSLLIHIVVILLPKDRFVEMARDDPRGGRIRIRRDVQLPDAGRED